MEIKIMKNITSTLNKASCIYGVARDTVKLSNGDMDKGEYVIKTAANVARYSSSAGGAAGGAALGTMICPGVGTAIGALAGAVISKSVVDSVFSLFD